MPPSEEFRVFAKLRGSFANTLNLYSLFPEPVA
jgi:hypothetical protein